MKKLLCIFIAVCTACCFTACSGNTTNEPSSSSPATSNNGNGVIELPDDIF